jgi:predicted phosphodiesterase
MVSSQRIKTRLLILSDTHGAKPKPPASEDADTDTELSQNQKTNMRLPTGYRHPLPQADVLIHCGDLTKHSRVEEFEATFSMLREAPAKLKLVLAGNHDWALDPKFRPEYGDDSGDSGELSGGRGAEPDRRQIWKIVKEAEKDDVQFLDEGTHTFTLDNGAVLRVYASPWTPEYGLWGFQYDPENGHSFDIPEGIDVAMTHGPAKGMLDTARGDHTHAGCPCLLRALEKAKPRIHCFGHIHEAWGAHWARWRELPEAEGEGTITGVDESRSRILMDLRRFWPMFAENDEDQKARVRMLREVRRKGGIEIDLTALEESSARTDQTLFLNAAIMSISYRPVQSPWLVDIDLPRNEAE